MVEARGLGLKLGKYEILGNVDFTVRNGRVTVLLGPNGSGKTSLMRVLSSLYGYEGSVRIGGEELKEIPSRRLSSKHASMPQNLEGVRFSLEELLTFSNDKARAGEAIHTLGLERFRNKGLDEMSEGEKALCYLGLLWSQKAELYLLDEPEASMDSRSRSVLYRVLRDLRKRDAAVLVTMHDLSRAMQVADDVIVLKDGKVAFVGTKEEFLSSRVSGKVFGVSPVKARTEEGEEFMLFL